MPLQYLLNASVMSSNFVTHSIAFSRRIDQNSIKRQMKPSNLTDDHAPIKTLTVTITS